jgi:hypothetical protein
MLGPALAGAAMVRFLLLALLVACASSLVLTPANNALALRKQVVGPCMSVINESIDKENPKARAAPQLPMQMWRPLVGIAATQSR